MKKKQEILQRIKTDSGNLVEDTKTRNNIFEGTRQFWSVTSGKGPPLSGYQIKKRSDCLIKTQGFAKEFFLSIKPDIYPMLSVKLGSLPCLVYAKVNGGCNDNGPKVAKFFVR